MSCGVCIGTSDIDSLAEFFNESSPVARKPHKCYECRGPIPAGAKYWKVVGKWDGDLITYHQCLPCHEIQIVFSCGEGYYYGELWNDWAKCDGFANLTVRDECFHRLSDQTRRWLVERWWKWKESEARG